MRRVGSGPVHEDRHELDKSGYEIDNAQTADRAAREVVRDERPENGPCPRKVVLLPEGRPGQHDEQQSDLEKERDVQEAANQGYPRASMFTRRLTRAATSR